MDTDLEVQPQDPNQIDIQSLKKASQFACFELALAIQTGKQTPFGYDKVADFYKRQKEKEKEDKKTMPLPHTFRAILVAEAEVAGRMEDLKKEFPSVPPATEFLVKHWKKTYPGLIEDITNRVSRPDYHFGRK